MKPIRSAGNQALRKGRISQENARYFLTLCTCKREPVLCLKSIPELIFENLQLSWKRFELIASVVMPDHVHLVIQLHDRNLSQPMQVFKSRSAIAINRMLNRCGPLWQAGFLDHKFRSDEDLAPILIYMWKNPTIGGRNFRCRSADWLWFKSMVTKDLEYPLWLRNHPMG